MFCMCCKLRHATSSGLAQTMEHAVPLQLPTLSPLAKNPLQNNPYNDLLSTFKELNEQPLFNLLQKQISTIKGLTRDPKHCQDLQETNLSEQATEDQKLYRLLFRRIYIENFTAQRLIRQDIRLLERVYYPESLERILIETIDKTAIIYRSILKEKVEEIVECTTIGREVMLRDFYHYFEEVVEIINVIVDYGKAIRTYSREADRVLRYLEASGMVDPLHDIHEEWLHRRCIRTVLQDPLLKSFCTLARSILKTNTLPKYESPVGTEALSFLVECCFADQSQQMLLSQSCSQFPEDDQDEQVIRAMKEAKIESRLQCQFSQQFLKNIERKIRRNK